ncbi:MAG: hypothetical protein WBL67_18765 [Nitrososphaeraceae archaeon]
MNKVGTPTKTETVGKKIDKWNQRRNKLRIGSDPKTSYSCKLKSTMKLQEP